MLILFQESAIVTRVLSIVVVALAATTTRCETDALSNTPLPSDAGAASILARRA